MTSAGKEDDYRQVDYKKWSENYERIFGKKEKEDRKKTYQPETNNTDDEEKTKS